MQVLKIATILWEQSSFWMSGKKISHSINAALKLDLGHELREFHLSSSEGQTGKVMQDILVFSPDVIIFSDPQVRPLELLDKSFIRELTQDKKIKVVFVVFGHIFDRLIEYQKCAEFIGHTNIAFIAASSRQQNSILSMCRSKETNSVVHLPFPLNTEEFKFSGADRIEIRNKIGLKEDDFLFLYSGRISSQKNVEVLISELNLLRKANNSIHLMLVGPIDDYYSESEFLVPFRTFYAKTISKVINEVTKDKKWISYQPKVNENEIRKYYSASDSFISFSTCVSEDFGMAVAEALSNGLPCVLTDWGGYSGFKSDGPIKYIDVTNDDEGLTLHFPNLEDWIKEARMARSTFNFPDSKYSFKEFAVGFRKKVLNENFDFCGFSDKKLSLTYFKKENVEELMDAIYGEFWKKS